MKRALSLGCALLVGALAACQQTWKLDDTGPEAGQPGTGGASGSSGGRGGFSPSDAAVDGRCFGQGQPIIPTGDRPLVVVALDRSSEMTGTQLSGSNNSQFDEAVNDLIAQVMSYAPGQHMNRRTIDFGYLEFPQGASCSSGCCASTADLEDSYSAFSAATATCDSPSSMCVQSTNHPLSNALMSASTFFEFGSGGSPSSERYVLVITDDAPSGNCSTVPMEDDCHAAQDAVVSLYNGSVTTVVVFVGNSQNTTCYPNFADDQGGGPPPYYGDTNLYYYAQGAQDLHDKIGTAIQAMAWGTCRFSLSSTPSSQSNLTVSQGQGQNATPILPDSKNGWTLDNNNNDTGPPRLVLHGSACSTYVASDFGGLQVYDACGTSHGPTP